MRPNRVLASLLTKLPPRNTWNSKQWTAVQVTITLEEAYAIARLEHESGPAPIPVEYLPMMKAPGTDKWLTAPGGPFPNTETAETYVLGQSHITSWLARGWRVGIGRRIEGLMPDVELVQELKEGAHHYGIPNR